MSEPEFYITNEVDKPCENLITVRANKKSDVLDYVNPELKKAYENGLNFHEERAVLLEDFGISYDYLDLIDCYRVYFFKLDSDKQTQAKYPDGKPRQWQGEKEFNFILPKSEKVIQNIKLKKNLKKALYLSGFTVEENIVSVQNGHLMGMKDANFAFKASYKYSVKTYNFTVVGLKERVVFEAQIQPSFKAMRQIHDIIDKAIGHFYRLEEIIQNNYESIYFHFSPLTPESPEVKQALALHGLNN